MKTYFASFGLAILAASSAACGGSDPLGPGAGNDPGDGTQTLYVEGRIGAEPRLANSDKETDFTTEFSIRIGLADVPVTAGTVTVKSRHASTSLVYQDDGNNLGHWVGTAANYDEVYQLDIIAGDNEVRSVVVDGPDIHTFTAPTAGASLDSTVANAIEWDRGDEADETTFRAEETDRITIPDSGEYSMAPSSMKAERDKTVTNKLELRRANSVVPAGAVAGSSVSVSILNEIEVIALANPAL